MCGVPSYDKMDIAENERVVDFTDSGGGPLSVKSMVCMFSAIFHPTVVVQNSTLLTLPLARLVTFGGGTGCSYITTFSFSRGGGPRVLLLIIVRPAVVSLTLSLLPIPASAQSPPSLRFKCDLYASHEGCEGCVGS